MTKKENRPGYYKFRFSYVYQGHTLTSEAGFYADNYKSAVMNLLNLFHPIEWKGIDNCFGK